MMICFGEEVVFECVIIALYSFFMELSCFLRIKQLNGTPNKLVSEFCDSLTPKSQLTTQNWNSSETDWRKF